MALTSFTFIAYSALLLILYYLIPKRFQWMLLWGASWLFYLTAGIKYLAFILFTTVSVYASACVMEKNIERQNLYLQKNKGQMSAPECRQYKMLVKKRNRGWLIACLTTNFLILAGCKFCITEPFRSLLETGTLSFLTVGLPLGISFFMFQSTGYLIDVYRGQVHAERNPFRFSLFISFFPQLIQGPISKYSMLSKSLYQQHSFNSKQVSFGLQRMLWGYFKKLVIADRIAVAVVALRDPQYLGAGFAVLTVFYAAQIYCDFTGGVDVAIGLSEALGITLPENFQRPFFSKNIAEYWRRWHITLGEWMKDYIFYPISVSQPMMKLSRVSRRKLGKFGKRLPVYIASLATWLVTGIWHGITPNFLLWGMMNCFVIIISEELTPLYQKFHNRFHLKEKPWYGAFEILRMFLLMNLIRACDLFPHPGDYFARIGSLIASPNWSFWGNGSLMKLGLSGLEYGILAVGIILIFIVSVLEQRHGSVREILCKVSTPVRFIIFYGLFLAVLLMGTYGIGYNATNFIYNQF